MLTCKKLSEYLAEEFGVEIEVKRWSNATSININGRSNAIATWKKLNDMTVTEWYNIVKKYLEAENASVQG